MVGEILDLIEILSNSYYHNAIEVLCHPALWMIAEKKIFPPQHLGTCRHRDELESL